MLSMLQAARRMAGASVSYAMLMEWTDYERDDLGDIVGSEREREKTVYGRVRLTKQHVVDGAGHVRGYEIVIDARCGMEPRPGSTVTPECGPFEGECFTIGGPQNAVLDAQGANWIVSASRG